MATIEDMPAAHRSTPSEIAERAVMAQMQDDVEGTAQPHREPSEATTVPPARLPGVLSFVIAAVVAAVAAGLELGWGVAAGVAAVSAGAVVAGLRSRIQPSAALLGPYVLVIVAKLAVDSARFGFTLTGDSWSDTVGSTDRTWFLGLVVAPVCLMLLGGYLIGRRYPVGSILAWWTPLLAGVDGLWTLALSARLDWDRPGPSVALATAALVETLVATWAVQRLLRPGVGTQSPAQAGLTARQRDLWTVLFVAGAIAYGVVAWRQAGLILVGVIVGSMMGGLIAWRKTTSRNPADPAFHVPLFLLLFALFYLHVGEEALTGFNQAIAALTGHPWSEDAFTLFIGLAGPAVWVFGGWSLWKRQPFGNFILWFEIVGMILGEPLHLLVFPVVRMAQTGGDYGYFSGMYTALFPMIPAIIMLATIIRAHRSRNRSQDQA